MRIVRGVDILMRDRQSAANRHFPSNCQLFREPYPDDRARRYRGVKGEVQVAGHRLDGHAGPLTADVSTSSYGSSGFEPSTISFPTQGCWGATGPSGARGSPS